MFSWFKRKDKSAKIAKDRLKIAITSDRTGTEIPFLEDLKEDIIKIIRKYKDVSNIDIRKVNDSISIEVELR